MGVTINNKSTTTEPENLKLPLLSTAYLFSFQRYIARPAGVHYNHCVSPSVRYQIVKILITFVTQGIC